MSRLKSKLSHPKISLVKYLRKVSTKNCFQQAILQILLWHLAMTDYAIGLLDFWTFRLLMIVYLLFSINSCPKASIPQKKLRSRCYSSHNSIFSQICAANLCAFFRRGRRTRIVNIIKVGHVSGEIVNELYYSSKIVSLQNIALIGFESYPRPEQFFF